MRSVHGSPGGISNDTRVRALVTLNDCGAPTDLPDRPVSVKEYAPEARR